MHSGSDARDGASSPRLLNIESAASEVKPSNCQVEVKSDPETVRFQKHSPLSYFCDIRRGRHVGSGWAAAHKRFVQSGEASVFGLSVTFWVLDRRLDKRSNLKMSPWTLGHCDERF